MLLLYELKYSFIFISSRAFCFQIPTVKYLFIFPQGYGKLCTHISSPQVSSRILYKSKSFILTIFLFFSLHHNARTFFFFNHRVQTGSGAHQPPIQWVPVLFPWGLGGRGVKLTTHLHLVPRSKIREAIPPLPNTPSWRNV
jgi:hypothetical protein